MQVRKKLNASSVKVRDKLGHEHNVKRYQLDSYSDGKLEIIFLHDLFDHHSRYSDSFQQILDKLPFDARVNSFDLYGQGRSVGHRGDLESFNQYTHSLEGLINYLQKESERKIVLIGIGLGALVTLKYLESMLKYDNKQVSGHIVMNPLLRFNENIFIKDGFQKYLNFIPAKRYHLAIDGRKLSTDNGQIIEFDGDLMNTKFVTVRKLQELRHAASQVRHSSYFINNPALYLLSADDEIYDQNISRIFFKGLNSDDARLIFFDNTKHDILHDKKQGKAITVISKWLSGTRENL